MNNLMRIKKECQQYIGCSEYVYTKCWNESEHIIVLQKVHETQTNEDRMDCVDRNTAIFRATVLKVIKIIDVNNTFQEICEQYEVGRMVYFDNYFLTIEPAFFHKTIPIKYTGMVSMYHDNGQKLSEGGCIEGCKSGHWIFWYENGGKFSEGSFIGGKQNGIWSYLHENTQKYSEGEYKEGYKSGCWIKWYEDGQKYCEGDYLKGDMINCWVYWHMNGKKASEGKYLYGEKCGVWKQWGEDGTLSGENYYGLVLL
jgi:hypothetical protein